jgi:MoaA/NifB/PqqE/SkfB family radical SAM enzyme
MIRPGHLYWEIADWCNYRCSYCWEGRWAPKEVSTRYAPDELIEASLRFFAGLDAGWTIRLSAGEPSSHPRLLDLARGVSELGHRVALETNLSLPLERYEEFARAAGTSLAYLHASLHLEHAEPEEFAQKSERLRAAMGASAPEAALEVLSVVTPQNAQALAACAASFERRGLALRLLRQFQNVRKGYARIPSDDLASLETHLDENFAARGADPLGQACLAGSRWLLLDIKGDLWRCHTARSAWNAKKVPRAKPLGSVLDGTAALVEGAAPCPVSVCHCPGAPIA